MSKNDIYQRLKSLRDLMRENDLSAYIIPSTDPHISEYPPERWKQREWISGFTGSAGTVVVTLKESGLWTDSRYFLQAEEELRKTEIDLYKIGEPNELSYKEWICKKLEKGDKVGLNGKLFSVRSYRNFDQEFSSNGIDLVSEFNLIDKIWESRPNIPKKKIYKHKKKFAGRSRSEKISIIRDEMKKKSAESYLVTGLDEIAWTFNIRGNDIKYSPLTVSYALINEEESHLFIKKNKVPKKIKQGFRRENVMIHSYEDIDSFLNNLESDSILVDPENVNKWIFDSIPNDCEVVEENPSIVTNEKALKTDEEIENIKNAMIKDGIVMVKFLHWLNQNVGKKEITEYSAAKKLQELRSERKSFVEPSFQTISGYKENAAMPHYKASEEDSLKLKPEGLFLVDSGGQYLDGTTDVTRTIPLGDPTKQERKDYTLVLKGHINLATTKFLKGSLGANIDTIPREPIWNEGINYKQGTGHGIGYFLNVHEGPQNLSQKPNGIELKEGMLISNEPGIYRKNKHGIRIENILTIKEAEKTEFGKFLKFKTLTLCPINLKPVIKSMLNEKEKKWIKNYHKEVYNKLSPYLNEEEREWLKNKRIHLLRNSPYKKDTLNYVQLL